MSKTKIKFGCKWGGHLFSNALKIKRSDKTHDGENGYREEVTVTKILHLNSYDFYVL